MRPSMEQMNMSPNPVQRDTVSHEIRLIKRRRIEIRSARAALDMEEFDLDDRLTLLEMSIERPARDVEIEASMNVGTGSPSLASGGGGGGGGDSGVALINQVEGMVKNEDAGIGGNTNRNESGAEGYVVNPWVRQNGSEDKKNGARHTRDNVSVEIIEIKEKDEDKSTNTHIGKFQRRTRESCASTANIITIDDHNESNDQDSEEDVISFKHKRRRKMPIQPTSNPVQILISNITPTSGRPPAMSFEQSEQMPGMNNPRHPATVKQATKKLTKIVVLKVRFDSERWQQANAALRRESIVAANKAMLNNHVSTRDTPPTFVRRQSANSFPRPKRGEEDETSSSFQNPFRPKTSKQMSSYAMSQQSISPIQMDRIPLPKDESQSPLTVSNRVHFPSHSLSPSSCPCQGRNRNCRTCTGTPAVIAENRVIPSPSSSRQSPLHVQTRMTRRPETYHIPDFEDMTAKSRMDLEMRFCQRIVDEFKTLINQARREGHGDSDIWIRELVAHEETSTTLINKLAKLVDKRAVPRVDDQGNWTGRRLVSECTDLTEFETGVRKIMGDMTELHPNNCCGEIDVENNGQHCWGDAFLSYFEDMLEKCGECMEACSVCINDEERKACVAEWSLT